jgi:hypothetical protein
MTDVMPNRIGSDILESHFNEFLYSKYSVCRENSAESDWDWFGMDTFKCYLILLPKNFQKRKYREVKFRACRVLRYIDVNTGESGLKHILLS